MNTIDDQLTPARRVANAVTALFVPGDRPERFAKAAASGAGVPIIDLEDAVAPEAKPAALAAVTSALAPADAGAITALVRVNPVGSPTHDTEIERLLTLAHAPGHGLLGLIVTKAQDPQRLASLRKRLPAELALVPLIESATGILNALEIAQIPGITRLGFGALDFALDINADGGDRFLDHARSQLVLASRAAGIAPPLDSPCTEIKDAGRITAAAKLARAFGFGGQLCIHPAQVDIVHAAFAPTQDEIRWAQSVISTKGGAAQVDGQMIDRPVIERASRVLAAAGISA